MREKVQQILAKIETSDGVDAAPGSSDAVLVYDPSVADDTDTEDNRPAGPTLSGAPVAIGRQTRKPTFKQNFQGSGDVSIPITEPDWGKFLRGSSWHPGTVVKVTLGAVTGSGFQAGEYATQSAGTVRGLILGCFTSGNVLTERLSSSGGHLAVLVEAGSAAFTAIATTGASSASTSTASAVAAYEGVAYRPTSLKLIRVTGASWSAGAPSLGENLRVVDAVSGVTLGNAFVTIDNSSMLDIEVTRLWGAIANGNKLVRSGGSELTIGADPAMTHCPSLTLRRNLDGRRKSVLGTRFDWELAGDAGKRMQFTWNGQGDLGTAVNTPVVVTPPLTTITAPRLLGSIVAFGVGAELQRHAIKNVSFAAGNTLSPDINANRAGGSDGSLVTDRAPNARIKVNNTADSIDWEAALTNATSVRVVCILGTTKGQIVGCIVPNGQVTAAPESNDNGISTYDLQINANRVQESGDDELIVFQL